MSGDGEVFGVWCIKGELKRQFAFVADDKRLAAKYREVAGWSYRQMLVYEEDREGQ